MTDISSLETAGEVVELNSELDWVMRLLLDGTDGVATRHRTAASVAISVEATARPFAVGHMTQLARRAWNSGGGEIVIEDVCGSGFDVRALPKDGRAEFTVRWRPSSTRVAARHMLPDRFQLLVREALLHYPVLWWASVHARAPLHAVACTAGRNVVLLAGPGGVGKSTLLQSELADGGRATSDNLCVGDGRTVWGLAEPMRIEGGRGPRTTHGRVEVHLSGRVQCLVPDQIVVVKRGQGDEAAVTACDAETAVRSLVTGTYAAGELSRFWAYAALLAAGSGIGPAQPAITETAHAFAARLDCFQLLLPRVPGTRLSDVLGRVEAIA